MRVPSFAIAALLACARADLCSASDDPLLAVDGQPATCVTPETCPRPDNLFVCLDTDIPDHPCVRCVDQRCVQVNPVRCE